MFIYVSICIYTYVVMNTEGWMSINTLMINQLSLNHSVSNCRIIYSLDIREIFLKNLPVLADSISSLIFSLAYPVRIFLYHVTKTPLVKVSNDFHIDKSNCQFSLLNFI